jgi:hypothetical protein
MDSYVERMERVSIVFSAYSPPFLFHSLTV